MKRMIAFVFLILCFLVAGTSCDIDPYEGERPYDYEGSVWIYRYKEYVFCLNTENDDECYYVNKEGEKRNITFLWSEFDSSVRVDEYVDGEKVLLLSGTCKFNKEWFTINLDRSFSRANYLPKEIRFERTYENVESE